MKKYTFLVKSIVLIFLFSLLILEACGLPNGRTIVLHMIIAAPFILYGVAFLFHKEIRLPFSMTILLIAFLFFVSLSTFTAIRIQTAFEHQLYYISLILIFIFVYNNKKIVRETISPFVTISTTLLISYSLGILFFSNTLPFPLPTNGYQFIYPYIPNLGHHPIGAFILIPLAMAITYFLTTKTLRTMIFTGICLIILVISSLRTAYMSFIFSTIVLVTSLKKKSAYSFISLGCMVLVLVALFIISDFKRAHLFQKILPYGQKELIRGREQYFLHALKAMKDRPLTGYGSAGYIYASMKYINPNEMIAETSLNMFLDIGSENGIVAMILFGWIMIVVFWKGRRALNSDSFLEKSIYIVFVSLFVLFQFHYYHRIYFLFMFFIIIAGLVYEEKKEVVDLYRFLFYVSLIMVLVNGVISASKIAYSYGSPDVALKVYPIYFAPYRDKITQLVEKQQFTEAQKTLATYLMLYPNEPFLMEYAGDMYSLFELADVAREYYKKSLMLFPSSQSIPEKIAALDDK